MLLIAIECWRLAGHSYADEIGPYIYIYVLMSLHLHIYTHIYTQLHLISASAANASYAIERFIDCISSIQTWMVTNRLKMNVEIMQRI